MIERIQNNNTSWIKWKSQANNGYSQQKQFGALYSSIPSQFIFKSDQWILLLRDHAKQIIQFLDTIQIDLFQIFSSCNVSLISF